MSQQALDFGRLDRVDNAHRRLLRAVADAVEAIGLYAAAGACDARRSELADALATRDHRYLRTEWLLAIADIASPDHRERILDAIASAFGYELAPRKKLKPEEKLARLEERIAKRFGEAGLERVEENRR